ncbi:MAG: DNA polymerase IV [Candidatus Nomurabacteria bacterium]|nr:DNA polymerase IV [Candidatus Nomurabacteria bacterium]
MSDYCDNLFLHADGDSFFVSCELSQHPEYIGMPVVVGEDRGIAVAMSYEAKKLGVTRGMPIFQIKKQFPNLIILSHHFDLYNRISNDVYNIFSSYLEQVEVYSIDECFMTVKQSDIKYAGGPEKLVSDIKNEIKNKIGVTYSFGLGRTKVLAKTASKLNKPNGMVLLLNKENEDNALKKTNIDDVWGIGKQTVPRLHSMGIKTAYDFANYQGNSIEKYFASTVYNIKQELSGKSILKIDYTYDPRDQKSIQSTSTFKPSSSDFKIIFSELSENIERACERARELNLVTNSVSFFVKNSNFAYHTGESHLSLYTNNPGEILNIVEPILYKLLQEDEKIRSTGITLKNLLRREDIPRDLFGILDKSESKNIIEEVCDDIRDKFGQNSLKHASSLKGSGKKRGNSFPKPFL